MRSILIIILLNLLGCNNFKQSIDTFSFKNFGGPLFSTPTKVTMKELHLDNGTLLGKEIIAEGAVVNIGKYSTYLIIADESGRMLVVLTDLPYAKEVINKNTPQMIRILGIAERGKRGLPYIMAKAIKQVDPEKKG